MPGQQQPPTGTVYFDRLTGGMMPYADPLVAGPQSYPHIWYDVKNLIPWRGRLVRREGIAPLIDNPPVPPEGPVADFPVLICGIQFREGRERFILVTTRNLWIGGGGLDEAFQLITPTYPAAGSGLTLTATNGSPVVTGSAGSDWFTRCIGAGQIIEIDGDWYTVGNVDSETQLTLTTNFTGTTGSYSYTIRRTFTGSAGGTTRQFAALVVLNGDIYLTIRDGGVYSEGSPITGTDTGTGVVLMIAGGADDSKTSFDSSDVSIVMSTSAMEAGTYALGQLFVPKGLEVLEDGRLVLPAHVWGLAPDPEFLAANRVLFSNHLDVFDWGINGGGFVDLIGARGGITAMKRFGGSLAVHFQDQIQLGQITGSDFDPLSWRPTRAATGASGARLIVSVPPTGNLPGGQVFLDTAGELCLFDGDQTSRLPTAWGDVLRDQYFALGETVRPQSIGAPGAHLNFDKLNRSVSLFYRVSTTQSYELRYHLDTGTSSRHIHKNFISAANEPRIQPTGEEEGKSYGSRILGVRGTNSAGAATAYLYVATNEALNDAVLPVLVVDSTHTTQGFLAETHDLMLAAPDREGRVLRVILWFYGRAAATETIMCRLSVDSGTTWETGVGSTAITLTDVPDERRVTYYFSTSAPADRARIRLESVEVDIFSFALSRMLIEYATVADVRAVP